MYVPVSWIYIICMHAKIAFWQPWNDIPDQREKQSGMIQIRYIISINVKDME
jgi:hypothetical protein